MDISHDNSIMAALTNEGKVLCWLTESPERKISIQTGDRVITAHRFIPGGNRLATGDQSGTLDIWDTSTGTVTGNAVGNQSAINCIAFDSTDGQMLTADDTGVIKLWTLANLTQPPVVFTDTEKDVIRLAFCEGGEAFLAATNKDVTQRPAHIRCMTTGLCDKVTRNLSEQEWNAWVGTDIEYEPTCPDKGYKIKVQEIRGAR